MFKNKFRRPRRFSYVFKLVFNTHTANYAILGSCHFRIEEVWEDNSLASQLVAYILSSTSWTWIGPVLNCRRDKKNSKRYIENLYFENSVNFLSCWVDVFQSGRIHRGGTELGTWFKGLKDCLVQNQRQVASLQLSIGLCLQYLHTWWRYCDMTGWVEISKSGKEWINGINYLFNLAWQR